MARYSKLLLFTLCMALAACSTPSRRPPPEVTKKVEAPKKKADKTKKPPVASSKKGWKKLNGKEIDSISWIDDLKGKDLEAAVSHSIAYYKRLPESRRFTCGGETYSSKEMLSSLELFRSEIKKHKGKDFKKLIMKHFDVFETQNSKGEALFTGYFEPVISGSLKPTKRFSAAVYERPSDLIEVNLGEFSDKYKGKTIRGKLKKSRLVPYDDREAIMFKDSLKSRTKPICYVHPVDLYYLQMQGSGSVKISGHGKKRVIHAGSNGRPFRAISSKVPIKCKTIPSQKDYLFNNLGEIRKILSHDRNYTFFAESKKPMHGAAMVPLTPLRSLAMDFKSVPKGGLVFMKTTYPEYKGKKLVKWRYLNRFALIQDTGGAIKGPGRADVFWGNGLEAEMAAGGMRQAGKLYVLVGKR